MITYPLYTENGDVQLSPHFRLSEFACKCGEKKLLYPGNYCKGAVKLCVPLVDILEDIRSWIGRPIEILSGYRCEGYHEYIYERLNRKRKKAGLDPVLCPTGSAHLWGAGVDINVFITKSDEGWLKNLGVTGIGYNLGGTESATHIDVRHKRFTTWGHG